MTLAPRTFTRLQDQIVSLVGKGPGARTPLVADMLHRDAREATSYWLQLLIAMGIATLGLVLGSAAVVIAAMLVAPLMGPIVALAMGLATGSPFLVLRSAGRVALSVVVVVGASSIVTLLLPFHELNAEIAARTSPTALDLVTAAFCALAGVVATMRPGSDSTAAAAGTSIGISLVPPLCVSGYGLGTASLAIAGGAALLFLTNLVAIVAVGTVCFVVLGFNRVDVAAMEHEAIGHADDAPISRAIASRLEWLFLSRAGPALRLLMPFVLLAGVYVPLRRALDEVAWQVRVRTHLQRTLETLKTPVVQARSRVEQHQVELSVVVVGTSAVAAEVRSTLDVELRRVAGIEPRLQVLAVPAAEALAGLEAGLLASTRPLAGAAVGPHTLDGARAELARVVEGAWPKTTAGPTLRVDVATEGTPLRISIVHFGEPFAPPGVEALERSVGGDLNRPVVIAARSVPSAVHESARLDAVFVAEVAQRLRAIQAVPGVELCLTEVPIGRRPGESERALRQALDALLAPAASVPRTQGDRWSTRVVRGTCAPQVEAPPPK